MFKKIASLLGRAYNFIKTSLQDIDIDIDIITNLIKAKNKLKKQFQTQNLGRKVEIEYERLISDIERNK